MSSYLTFVYQGYLISLIKFTCMQFSRYDIDWIFISHIRGKIFFLLISLVKPVIITALPGWYGLASDLSIIYWLHPVSDRAHFPMPVFMFSRLASVVFFFWSGVHLLSHIVSNAVPSAACVLTVVFGMGTGVSHKRIDTRNVVIQFALITQQ